MINDLTQLRRSLEDFYPGITNSCKNCDYPDCKGYLFLIKDEVDNLVESGIPVLCVNNNIYLINNFKEKNSSYDLSEISPKCKLRCSNGMCAIHDIKPLVCLLYPLMIEKYEDGEYYWSLHKQCQYYDDLEKQGIKEELVKKINKFIDSISPDLYQKIITTFFDYDSIVLSNNTNFDIEIIKKVEKPNVKEVKNYVKV